MTTATKSSLQETVEQAIKNGFIEWETALKIRNTLQDNKFFGSKSLRLAYRNLINSMHEKRLQKMVSIMSCLPHSDDQHDHVKGLEIHEFPSKRHCSKELITLLKEYRYLCGYITTLPLK